MDDDLASPSQQLDSIDSHLNAETSAYDPTYLGLDDLTDTYADGPYFPFQSSFEI